MISPRVNVHRSDCSRPALAPFGRRNGSQEDDPSIITRFQTPCLSRWLDYKNELAPDVYAIVIDPFTLIETLSFASR